MRKRLIAGTAAMLSLVATPVLANPASSLSLSNGQARVGSPAKKGSHFAGNAIIPIVLGVAIIGGGIYIAADSGSDKAKSR